MHTTTKNIISLRQQGTQIYFGFWRLQNLNVVTIVFVVDVVVFFFFLQRYTFLYSQTAVHPCINNHSFVTPCRSLCRFGLKIFCRLNIQKKKKQVL